MHCRTVAIILTITVLYAVIGGIIFHVIESPHEQQIRETSRQQMLTFLAQRPCLNLSTVLTISKLLDKAKTAGLHAFPGSNNLTYITNWDLSSSIFLAFQVIGSVGYGNAPPMTTGGRVFCIIFGLIGIPLLLLAGLGIGYLMIAGAERIRKCCIRHAGPKDAVKVHIVRTLIIFVICYILFILIPAGILTATESTWTYGDAIYFCMTSVLTIGIGDFVPGTDWDDNKRNLYRLGVGFWLIISLLVFAGLWTSVNIVISSTREMEEPLEIDEDFGQTVQTLTGTIARRVKKLPKNYVAFIPNAGRSPQNFYDATLATAYNPDPYTISQGPTANGPNPYSTGQGPTAYGPNPYTNSQGPLYNVAVAQGEVTHVHVH